MKMKPLFILFLAFVSFGASSQDTLYYDDEWNVTENDRTFTYYGVENPKRTKTGQSYVMYFWKDKSPFSYQLQKNGIKLGTSVWFHSNGQRKWIGNYVNGVPNGTFKMYNDQGVLIKSLWYKDGSLTAEKKPIPKIIKHKDSPPNVGIPANVEMPIGQYDSRDIPDIPVQIQAEIIDYPDVEATFPGGAAKMYAYINRSIIYPAISIKNEDQGKVYVKFVVEKDGEISQVYIERGVTPELDKEAKRIMRTMPKWQPGEMNGKKVRTRCRLPIVFTLD